MCFIPSDAIFEERSQCMVSLSVNFLQYEGGPREYSLWTSKIPTVLLYFNTAAQGQGEGWNREIPTKQQTIHLKLWTTFNMNKSSNAHRQIIWRLNFIKTLDSSCCWWNIQPGDDDII